MIKGHNNLLAKSSTLSIINLLIILFFCTNCNLPDMSEPTMGMSYIYGQVYNLSHPGPVPVGWTPPPFKQVSTIRILNNNKNLLSEITTDSTGFFDYAVNPGTYYVSVKESPVQSETGPIVLRHKGDGISIKLYYDNGMR